MGPFHIIVDPQRSFQTTVWETEPYHIVQNPGYTRIITIPLCQIYEITQCRIPHNPLVELE